MLLNLALELIGRILPEPHASLMSGMLFGTKESLPSSLYESLVRSGTLHIVALSGMNITILINIAGKVFAFLGRRTALKLSVVFIVIFILFVGPSPSVVRAGIMGSIGIIGNLSGRKGHALLALVIASLIMLIIKAGLLFDISFQLSFLATLGIIAFAKPSKLISNKKSLFLSVLGDNLRISLAAQVFTMPVILYNFHRLSLVSPLANIFIAPLITPVMASGMLMIVCYLIFPPVGILVSYYAWFFLSLLLKVVEITSRLPGSAVEF